MSVHLSIVSTYPAATHVPNWTAAGIVGYFLVALPFVVFALVGQARKLRAQAYWLPWARVWMAWVQETARANAGPDPLAPYAPMALRVPVGAA